jgi:hypothetical protein
MRNRLLAAALVASLGLAGAARADHTWGVGLHGTTQHITPADGDVGYEVQLAGGGLQARWRMIPRFGIELAFEGLGGAKGEAFKREAGAVGLTGMLHLTIGGPWDLYLLIGVGTRSDTVTLQNVDGEETVQEFKQTFVSAGIGLEYLWTHFGVGAEVRAVGYARDDGDEARTYDAVPAEAAGAQGTLTATYYF